MCALLFQVLDSNGITHMCTLTVTVRLIAAHVSAEQGQILLLSADLHQYAGDKHLKQEWFAGKWKINLILISPPPPYSLSTFPISIAIKAACGKVCSFVSSGHCSILGVKMRRHFDFGDLLLSSCCICKAHHYSQPSPPLQLSVHFFLWF